MYQYLLFDLDGTLTDSKPGIINCVKYALDKMNYKDYDDTFLNQFVGPPLMVSFPEFCGFNEEDTVKAVAIYRERFSTIGLFENSAYDGAITMLKTLKAAGKRIALSTSKPEPYTLRIIERFGLAPYIEEPVGATLDGSRDTKAEVIAEALKRFQIDTPEKMNKTIMIGDRKHDILGANAMNLDSIGCRWGYADPCELEHAGATYIVDTIDELTEFLLK